MTSIRLLNEKDATQFKKVRLEMLQHNPNSFLSTYDAEAHQSDHFFKYTLMDGLEAPHFGYFGYFEDEKLIGYVQLTHLSFPKQLHTAQIFNLSVLPEHRGKGIAKQLMTTVLDHAKQAGIEMTYLSCLSSNVPAQKLYTDYGFKLTGKRTAAVKWNDEYQDELIYSK